MGKSHLLAAAAGAVAASALAGGVAWATVPGDGGVIQGCYTKVGGILRVVDADKGQHCLGIEAPIAWNQKGPKGDPGAAGVSPTVAQLQPGDAGCPAGGAAITGVDGSTAHVCNGTNGESFSGTATSPNGQYSISVTDAGIVLSNGQGTSLNVIRRRPRPPQRGRLRSRHRAEHRASCRDVRDRSRRCRLLAQGLRHRPRPVGRRPLPEGKRSQRQLAEDAVSC